MPQRSQLPFLPGFSFSDPTKCNFHLPQTLTYEKGYQIQCKVQRTTPKSALEFIDAENALKDCKFGELTYGERPKVPKQVWVPAHVAYDKKVLNFHAYFKQEIPFSADETYRVRKVRIYYYLEDDTMQIIEPFVDNSGFPQGTFLRRQRYPKNSLGDFWNWRELNVGMNFTIYGHTYRIYDCDLWTREFLTSQGIEVNEAESVPVDPYLERRTLAESRKLYTIPSPVDSLWKFLHFDRQVLRFYCIWDDRDAMYGDLHKCILHYYLSDDTIEILEVHEANDGRDPAPVLVHRHRIPKDRNKVPADFPLINMSATARELKDFYTQSDLRIGNTLFIYGRKIYLYDCDPFTQEFYRKYYGIEDFTPHNVQQEPSPPAPLELPPHTTGIGSWDDSLESFYRIELKYRPPKDLAKMLLKHPKFLRYKAEIIPKFPNDKGRKFLIYYYLGDDTVMIYEPYIVNSGFDGGLFLRRSKLKKSGGVYEAPVYYTQRDFYLGAIIEAAGQKFQIIDADQYVLSYMELHPEDFSEAALDGMRSKFRGVRAKFEKDVGEQPIEQTNIPSAAPEPIETVVETTSKVHSKEKQTTATVTTTAHFID